MTDYKVLENIYDESASLFWDKKEFIRLCREEMMKDYPSILIWRDKGRIDCGHGMDYSFEKKHRDNVLNKGIKNVSKQKDTIQTKRSGSDPAFGEPELEVSEDEGKKNRICGRSTKLIRNKKPNPRVIRI
jgi:hypothetical protein